ncbi:hypothetical protein B0H14DRAFT_2646717 [Mycena olivaceomarginata]|nr:hypothetical protein B0H14DRAFT_2646717 [Mycena olivaceomarginata]
MAVRADVRRENNEPIYETFSATDHGGDNIDDDDQGGRDLRDSDDPLRQWAEDHRTMYLSEMLRREGRGDHNYTMCPRCNEGKPDHQCKDCLGGGELLCASCMLDGHSQLPFHRIELIRSQQWQGSFFTPRTLKDMGLRIQLGHWKPNNRVCSVPDPAPNDDFVIVHENGVHPVHLDYCGCGRGGLRKVQLLRARLWAAMTTHLRTTATFSVLRSYHLHSFESKCAALEFYQALGRQTDNLHRKKEKMLKHAGRGHEADSVGKTAMGECTLLCPACPQPGKNLPPGWEDVPDDKQFLYALFLALDANFRLKRKDVSSEKKDPGLGNGWAFFLRSRGRSHCVAHDAVDKPDREAQGTASSGVGVIDCARHNMKRPRAVGNLQLGEQYINMDYMFFASIAGSPLMRYFVLYDIAYDTITIDGAGKFMTFLVPKFHLPVHIEACNLNFPSTLPRDVGQTDGEAPERGRWRTRYKKGRGRERLWQTWTSRWTRGGKEMDGNGGEVGRADISAPNPFETMRKDQHLARVRAELAAEAAAREVAGKEDAGAVKGDMHITELIAMGLQLEDQQRVLAFDIAATGLHPTDGQRRAMIERTSKLRRKIVAWAEVQQKFFPMLANIREREDEERARAAERGSPSPGFGCQISCCGSPQWSPPRPNPMWRGVTVTKAVQEHEYWLRMGQANEALHELRRLLLVQTHLHKLKDMQSRGVRANMRSGDKIAALNEHVQRAGGAVSGGAYSVGGIGRVLNKKEWEWTLLLLREDDIRGLPKSQFRDPERKKKKRARMKKRVERELSWIWVNRGEWWEPGDNVAMNEAVRIEWAKTRARAMRWAEEVDLLDEEMRRTQQWTSEDFPRGRSARGETAYALRQAGIQAALAEDFAKEWVGLLGLISGGRADRGVDGAVDGAGG